MIQHVKIRFTSLYYFQFSRDEINNETTCICPDTPDLVASVSFFVAPNMIDFSTVFSKFDIAGQAAVLSALVVIFTVFVVAAVTSRLKDGQDVLQACTLFIQIKILCQTVYYAHRLFPFVSFRIALKLTNLVRMKPRISSFQTLFASVKYRSLISFYFGILSCCCCSPLLFFEVVRGLFCLVWLLSDIVVGFVLFVGPVCCCVCCFG